MSASSYWLSCPLGLPLMCFLHDMWDWPLLGGSLVLYSEEWHLETIFWVWKVLITLSLTLLLGFSEDRVKTCVFLEIKRNPDFSNLFPILSIRFLSNIADFYISVLSPTHTKNRL